MLRITMTSRGELPMATWEPKPCILLRCIEVVAPFSGTDRVIIQVWTWQGPVYKLEWSTI